MIEINEFREAIQTFGSQAINEGDLNELLNRLEEAEKDTTLKERIIDSLGSTLDAVSNERDVLRDRLALESQENGALRDSVDRACEEREELHMLVAAIKKQARSEYALRVKKEEECAQLRSRIEEMKGQEPSREWWDNLIADISAIDCMYRGSPTYAHDAYWMRDRVVWMLKQRRDAIPGAQPAPSIPEGWKLVPIEPTPEMVEAASGYHSLAMAWRAAINVAPEAKP